MHIITEKVELPSRTLLDLFYELMADAMGMSVEEAQQVLETKHK